MFSNTSTEVVYDCATQQRLNGTAAQTSTALTVGRWYTLFADVPVRVRLSSNGTAATATNGFPVQAGPTPFKADNHSTRCSIIHEDGTTAFDCMLVPSGPPVS